MFKKICIMIAAGILAFAVQSGVLENFTGPQLPLHLNEAVKRNQQAELTAAPDGVRAVRLSWANDRFNNINPIFNKPALLPLFEQATVTVKVYTPDNCPANRVNLRLIDAQGEVFQWDQAVSWRESGWKTLTYNITPAGAKISWGGNNDKKLDQPARFFGLGIDLKKDSGTGELLIGPITFTSGGGKKVASTEKFCSFSPLEKWLANFFLGQGTLNLADDGLTISGKAGSCMLRDRIWSLLAYPVKPAGINLQAELLSGNAAVSFIFRDNLNKSFTTPALKLVAGQTAYPVDLSGTLADAIPPLKIEEIQITSASRDLNLKLKQADFIFKRPLIETIRVDVLTGNPIHVLKAGDEKALQLQFINQSAEPAAFRARSVFTDFSGHSFTIEKTFKLEPRRSGLWQPDRLPDSYGIWKIDYTLTDLEHKDSIQTKSLSFAYMKPAGPTPERAEGFLFSICTHTGSWSERDQEKEVLAAALCGAKVIRTGSEWSAIQPQDSNHWDWGMMDRLVRLYGQNGIELQYTLAFTTKWAAPKEKQQNRNWRVWSRSAPDLDAWSNYAKTIVQRYKDKIHYWEVWNEPDLSGFGDFTADEYIKMLQVASKAVKTTDPQAIVMTAGFATMSDHPGRRDNQFQEKVLRNAKGSFDVHAYHEHGNFINYTKMVDEKFMPLRRATGTAVPWYANETAISSMDGAEAFQAEILYKKMLFAWSRGAIGYTWYDLRNDGFNPKEGEHNYGMFTNDFYPKPVYPVYNALVTWFKGMKFDRQLELGVNLWAFVFKNSDRIIIPCWNESAAAATRHIVIKTDARKAEHVDIMGNASPVPLLDGMTILELGPVPSALNLIQVTKVEAAGALVEVNSSGVAVPGHKFELALQLTNPLKEEREFRLKLQLPKGITAEKQEAAVAVPAKSGEQIGFKLNIASDMKGEYGIVPKIKLAYSIAGTPWQSEIAIPVNLAISIPAKGFERKPDFVLNTREQVVSLCAHDPAKTHLVWRDANDLSAKIWLASDENTLRLKAVVTDDIHCQPYSGNSIWQGDSIQFALNVPGQAGTWEICLSRLDNGTSEVFVGNAPQGFNPGKVMKQIKLETSRQGNDTIYQTEIKLTDMGLTPLLLHQGLRFNLLVNDNDGELREGWIQIAPNLGTNKNPGSYPFIIFK